MADVDQDDGSVYRLEGSSGTQKGGLVIMKKTTATDVAQHEFKKPSIKKSLLGLDRLAAIKRAENEQTSGDKDRRNDRWVNLTVIQLSLIT
jgi:pre-mRNA-splicing factor ATP-dependent RNA helicase DHX38/PRP16